MEINVGISNRHIHLKKEHKDILFGENYELKIKKELSQHGQYACEETLTIKTDNGEIKNVRVLGPLRNYTQVEISKTDAYTLKINPPVRESGDLKGSETVMLIGPNGTLEAKESAIIASRHIHINTNDLEKYNLTNNEKVKIKIFGEKGVILDNVKIKSDETYTLELHIDTDDANAFLLKNGDIVKIEKE